MQSTASIIGVIVIGAALAAPLLYGISTLLGLTHKQFRPIFRGKHPDGTRLPAISGNAGLPAGGHGEDHKPQRRRKPWSQPGI